MLPYWESWSSAGRLFSLSLERSESEHLRSDGMEHWPGHERIQITDKSKDKGKHKEYRLDPTFWRWPHLEYGSIGSATLVSKDGRVRWSTAVDTSPSTCT